MANMNFNTTNSTFRQLMGNGMIYTVPKFQRDYSWTSDEWDDLWQDIQALDDEQETEQSHYMGYLVLQSDNSKQFDIIDGQQRITTLSIMILAALSILDDISGIGQDPDNNQKRQEQLRNSYIGYLDPVTLIPKSKLELNRHNNSFYQDYLVPLNQIPQRGLKSSEHLLRKAFYWFKDKMKPVASNEGEKIAAFIDNIVDKLFFTVITVTDELNAFKVFETLNARGVRLSATDLLKNYLFSVVNSENPHENEITSLEERWEKIVGILGNESFPEFLRIFWNSQNKLARKTDLFKTIRKSINTKKQVFELIRNLDENANIYSALRYPHDELWNQNEKSWLQHLRLFNVRQPLALLLATFLKFSDSNRNEFRNVLRAITVLSLRYNVICNMLTNEQERLYNEIAVGISSGKLTSAKDVISYLARIYPEDDTFKSAFNEKELRTANSRNNKVVRYILFEIERHVSGQAFEFESDKYNIEHILPEHPDTVNWPDFDEHNDAKFIYRLGNMTIMDSNINKDLGCKSYNDKKDVYANSQFQITKNISDKYSEWNSDKISSRQNWMASQATSIWRIDL